MIRMDACCIADKASKIIPTMRIGNLALTSNSWIASRADLDSSSAMVVWTWGKGDGLATD